MKKLIGSKKLETAIFISGTGSNLKSLYKFSKLKKSPIKINLVISNNSNAKGLIFATKNKIKTKICEFKKGYKYENKIITELKKNKIKFICLAGFMKILSRNFIKKFKYKIINIHPSLLPRYKGLNTHYRAIKNKDKFSGCTVHYVNSKLDSGKIILQEKVKISKYDTPKSLQKKILKKEHILYQKALLKIFSRT
tara:strand:- start:820 stop:1404 length:585 start_codon:yes stop_codon:yes gene_type:complete